MIKFAFYGRVSTEDQQDPESSKNWQLVRSRALIESRGGVIVSEFFDVNESRSIPWQRRPAAAALLAELGSPGRGFSAVVVGEPHRAFYGNQYGLTIPLFHHYGVPLWVPEVGGPIDPVNEAHDLVMSVFGGMSKGERNRVRVRAAMAAQAQVEGRFLGGRPPFGYLLADAGPHPSLAKAADGKRLHKLVPDPETAWVVRRIFAEYRAGGSFKVIAEGLTRDGIECPSAYDRARNPHRSGTAWASGAVRAIIGNPRYTGRQVWNKQTKAEVLIDVNDVALGHTTTLKWNDPAAWVWSEGLAQEPLVDDDTFAEVQALRAARGPARERSARRTARTYALRGILRCGVCRRKMHACWNNGRAYYRCKLQAGDLASDPGGHPKSVYVREDRVVECLDGWLALKFAPAALSATIRELRALPADSPRDAGGVGGKSSPLAVRDRRSNRMAAKNAARVIQSADRVDRVDLYSALGLTVTYDPRQRRVAAEARLVPHEEPGTRRRDNSIERPWVLAAEFILGDGSR